MGINAIETANVESRDEIRQGRLLLVDDEPSILATLVRMFRPRGFITFTADSGVEGLAILAREDIDLVISDMRMPNMDGASFLTEVSRRWPDIITILLTGYSDIEATAKVINKARIYAYFSKPWDRDKLLSSVEAGLKQRNLEIEGQRKLTVTQAHNVMLEHTNSELEAAVTARTEELRQTNLFLESAFDQVKHAYFDAVDMFAQIIERFEHNRGGHSRRIASWAEAVALSMGLDDGTVKSVRTAALLHDIGKIGMPESLLFKPATECTPEEAKRMQEHPVAGAAILMSLEPLHEAARMIRHHHERFDGRGYPDGLLGEVIPLGSRIICVCDHFDRLTQGYTNGKQMTIDDAMDVMRSESGKMFHSAVVDSFIAMMEAEQESKCIPHERAIATQALEPGMKLSRTLLTSRKLPLIVAGKELTSLLINKLRSYESDSKEEFLVYIYDVERSC